MNAQSIDFTQRGPIDLHGDARDIGFLHGTLLSQRIKHLLADDLCRINRIRRTPLTIEAAANFVKVCSVPVRKHLPSVWEEIEGLASGSQITMPDALILQFRRELTMTKDDGLSMDCSTVCSAAGAEPVLAQTIDLPGGVGDLGLVLRIRPSKDSAPSMLVFSFVGLLGYMGINSAGLAVGINMISDGIVQVGVPPYLMVRAILAATSIDEALAIARRVPMATARSFTLCQRDAVVVLECGTRGIGVLRGNRLFHTNHVLSRDLPFDESLDAFSRYLSVRRLDTLKALSLHMQEYDNADLTKILADHNGMPFGICAHSRGEMDSHRPVTVAAVICRPARNEMHVCFGRPCETAFTAYSL